MPVRRTNSPSPPTRREYRDRLAGTSIGVLALALAVLPTSEARAGMGSPQFYAALATRTGSGSAGGQGASASTALSIPVVAQEIANRTQATLRRALASVTAAAEAQAAAAAAAVAQPSAVLDGIQASTTGLPAGAAPGLVALPNSGADLSEWQGANLPTQTTADGATQVTVTQTAPKAIATWQSFNVGKNTVLTFDQTAGTDQSGNNAWVVLNRIEDPSGNPSQILGRIQAKGSVYVINPNGVVFNGSSIVDVHALVASSLDIGQVGQDTAQRNAQFLQNGLNVTTGLSAQRLGPTNVAFSEYGQGPTALTPAQVLADTSDAPVIVQPGAQITTSVFPSDNPGSVMLLGSRVVNGGTIVSPAGQVILGAGRAIAFAENTTVNTSLGADYLGLVPVTQPTYTISNTVTLTDPRFGRVWNGTISALNTGVIETSRGNITLQGTQVENDGVLEATTSITRNGSIVMQGEQAATLGPGSVTTILPDPNGETIPLGQVSATTVPLPFLQIDAPEQSGTLPVAGAGCSVAGQIGCVSLAGSTGDQAGALVVAPGATASLNGTFSIELGGGATIDVAGLTTGAEIDTAGDIVAALPMADNFVTFKPLGPELANSPLQRSGPLRGQSITIDARISGTSSNGIAWIGTPLANASGYVNTQISENIEQLLTKGGSVSLVTTGLGVGSLLAGSHVDSIVLDPGSVIDVSGGYTSYSGGYDIETNLVAADGQIVPISKADPSVTYRGIAGSYTFDSAHWGISQSYTSGFFSSASAAYEPGYIEGAAAGSITFSGADAVEADGSLFGQASAGPLQRLGVGLNAAVPLSGTLTIASATPKWVLFQAQTAATTAADALVSQTTIDESNADFPLAGLDPNNRADTIILSSDMLDAGDFGSIAVSGSTRVAPGASVIVANGGAAGSGDFQGGGGTISIAGPAIDIEGRLSAAAGKVTLTANGLGDPSAPADSTAIMVGADAIIDVRGRWINDSGSVAGTSLGADYLNGGTISLQSIARAENGEDTTGGIVVAAPDPGHGPQLLAASGGYVAASGKIADVSGATGVPTGTGGSVSFVTYAGGFSSSAGANPFPTQALSAGISLDPAQSISAFGFASGGTLTISVATPIVIVDADVAGTGSLLKNEGGVLVVNSGLLNDSTPGYRNPFATIDLESDYGSVTVAQDLTATNGAVDPWTLVLDQSVSQTFAGLAGVPSYSSFGAGTPVALVLNQRSPAPATTFATGLLPQFQRAPANLVLGPAGQDIRFYPDAGPVIGSIGSADPTLSVSYDLVPGSTVVQSGVVISSQPSGSSGASITLNSTFLTELDGAVDAPAGKVVVESTGEGPLTSIAEIAGRQVGNGVVVLGAGSVIDVAGVAVTDAADTRILSDGESYIPEQVLAGGTVTLKALGDNAQLGASDSFGYFDQFPGSVIDVSGAVGTVPILNTETPGRESISTEAIYSDAGAVIVDATAGILDGTLHATGGAPAAAAGIFSLASNLPTDVEVNPAGLLPDQTGAFTVSASAVQVSSFLNPVDENHFIALSSATIDRAGFDDVNIGQIDATGSLIDLGSINFAGNASSTGAGNVALTSRRSLLLAGPVTAADVDTHVRIDTSYLTLTTTDENQSVVTTADATTGTTLTAALNGSFTAKALDIVLERGVIDAGVVDLIAAGDVAIADIVGERINNFGAGGIVTTGDLSIRARRLYPMGGAEGIIQSLGKNQKIVSGSFAGGSVSITSPVGPADTAVPLAAGGALYLLGNSITQDGVVDAPGGSIVFGDALGAQFFYFDGNQATLPTIRSATSVRLGAGSATSVSLDGQNLPYGGTVDETSWYYADPTRSESAITAPPAKSISVAANKISFDAATATAPAARVDISGGGNLYATEFVAGNGGSANVLAPDSTYTAANFNPAILGNVALYNTVGTAGSGTRTYNANTNSTSQVYAIVPLSENPSLAPSDLDFLTYASSDISPLLGTTAAANPGTGFGNPAPPMGLSITLSGASGVPDGTYTLLPAAYATLPGAYRVVVLPGSQNFQAAQNTTLPDGTMVVSTTVTTPLASGIVESGALPIAVELQTQAVWGRYSDIVTTGANGFFTALNANAASVPRLPEDAGSITFDASSSLTLSGTLDGSASAGLSSLVAVAAKNLQVLASDKADLATSGFVTIDATQLTDLDAGSLVLGGTESTGTDGLSLTATSFNVEITSDAANPLSAPEILIVTRGQKTTGLGGIMVDPGAVIEANGSVSGDASPRTLTIGSVASKIVGDGAFIAVTDGSPITLDRADLPQATGIVSPVGTVTIGAGAVIRGGNDLVIDASDGTNSSQIDPTAQLSATNVSLSATAISLGDDGVDGLVIPDAVIAQFLGATSLTLHGVGGGNGAFSANGTGDIEFAGITSLSLTAPNAVLTLDTTALSSFDGNSISISAPTIDFADTTGTGSFTPMGGAAALSVSAGTIDFGTGSAGLAFDQFGQVSLTATKLVDATGTLPIQADANVTITTPLILGDTGSSFSLATSGTIALLATGGSAPSSGSALGGSLAFSGEAITADTALVAPSGNILLEATSGDLILGGGASLSARGYSQVFFDATKYAAGGNVRLTADQGKIDIAEGATVAVDAAPNGGDAGTLDISAVSGAVGIEGTISGAAPTAGIGAGGKISLIQNTALDLTALSSQVTAGGFTGAVSVETGQGDLDLGSTGMTAASVSLIAQGGAVNIAAGTTINASGTAGGSIALFGNNGVDLEGRLVAVGSSATQAGGTVTIGAAGTKDTITPLNSTYGYENVSSAGLVTFGPSALIDVSGGTVAGETGGTVKLEVPLLENGTVAVAAAPTATVRGSYQTVLEGYAVWRTSDDATQTKPALEFDGIVDPAGTDTAAGSGDHVGFYGTTLVGFVQSFPAAPSLPASLGAVHFQPGIELINDTSSVNSGDITVASAWNLGAGGYDSSGTVNLFYRTAAGEPGTLDLRAIGNVNVEADLTDGFFQTSNRLDPTYEAALASSYLVASGGNANALAPAGDSTQSRYVTPLLAPTAPYDTTDSTYTTAYAAYLKIYDAKLATNQMTQASTSGYAIAWSQYQQDQSILSYPASGAGQTPDAVAFAPPTAPNIGDFATYAGYVAAYKTYLTGYTTALDNYAGAITNVFQPPPAPAALSAPSVTDGSAAGAEYTTYTMTYRAFYSLAYLNYVNSVNNLAGTYNYTATNLDGSDQLYEAPTAPTAPLPFGSEIGVSTAIFTAASDMAGLYGANGVSPNAGTSDQNPVMSANLVPATAVSAAATGAAQVLSQGSWSFQVVGGAETASVDPLSLKPLSAFAADPLSNTYNSGTVTLSGHTTYTLPAGIRKAIIAADPTLKQVNLTALVPTLIRTGTGTIDIAAATDIDLTDPLAPGTIYTAGAEAPALPSADYVSTNGGTALNGSQSVATIGGSGDGTGVTMATDPAGFDAPNFGSSFLLTAPELFAVTEPSYPESGGSVTLTAQNDITGVESTETQLKATKTNPYVDNSDSQNRYLAQYWSDWLFGVSAPIPGATVDSFSSNQGLFNPGVGRFTGTQVSGSYLTAGQTTWWINFGSFDQGVAALGGGNVTVAAGHNITQFSASTASTGRVSGGLDAADLPVLHLTGGGNLTVSAGNDIISGSYYVALGIGKITAGGSITNDAPAWKYTYTDSKGAVATATSVTVAPAIVLGVGEAQLSVSAVGSVDIGDVVNPTEIESGVSIVVGDDYIANNGGASSLNLVNNDYLALYTAQFNTMSPDSSVSIASIGANVDFLTLPTGADNKLYQTNYRVLPASGEVTAYRGQVQVNSSFDMTNSNTGSLNIYAYTNVRLAGTDNQIGFDPNTSIPPGAASEEAGIATYQTENSQTISTVYPVPGLVDTQFDPLNPTADITTAGGPAFVQTADPQYLLLHADGGADTRLYALQGDVTNGVVIADPSAVPATTLPMPLLTDSPATVQAGQDILNLQLYAQDTQSTDVTSIIAGRDITYNLPQTNLSVTSTDTNGLNLIELAGPGALVLEAGRNLGPFPNNFNDGPSGVETTGAYDWTSSVINPLLSTQGASVSAYAGVGKGIDTTAEIAAYLNPATAGVDSFLNISYAVEYAPELLVYLRQLGPQFSDLTLNDAFSTFADLSTQQQQVFLNQVFFTQLQTTQSAPDILSELLAFEASRNLIGYTMQQVYGLFQNGASLVGQTLLTQAYTVFADLAPSAREAFVDEIATDTSTQAPNIWHAYSLFEGLTAAQRQAFVPASSPQADIAYIDSLTPAQRQTLVHEIGTEALVELPSLWNVPGYARGYQMIDTVFPGAFGYTQNRLSGGLGASGALVSTGNIDLRSATIQTQHGGNIQIFAPGGGVLLGSTAARSIYNQPGSTGLLTFQGGSIDVFADQSLTVNQSRILTEEGGDVLTWSSNRDILAGSGAKTSADFPPYTVLYDTDGLQSLDPAGLVTGAGIGALVTVNNQDPTQSNDYFMTPVGTVDAGDAGLRAAGNIVVAAAHVANAANISVGGKSTGVPTVAAVNVGAAASASSAAASAVHAGETPTAGRNGGANNEPSVISIDVIGFGAGDNGDQPEDDDTKKKKGGA